MTLIDEREEMLEQEKKQKTFKLIIRLIVILLIVGILLLIIMNIKKSRTFKLNINGELQASADDSLLLKDDKGKILVENGQVYVSIRNLATTLNYQYYNSEYKKKGEDKTKCQVKVNNIYTSYISESKEVYKAIIKDTNNENTTASNSTEETKKLPQSDVSKVDFEYFTISDSIRYINDEMYASLEAIELGFDISISYNSKNNTLSIGTLDYLEKAAKEKRADIVLSENYSYLNKRLLKYGMCIVKDSDGNIGVGSYTNPDKISSFVASCKYSSIEFNEANKTLSVVTSNDNQKSILSLNIENQEVLRNITSQYKDIKAITNNFDYFLVQNDGKYGIINVDGNLVIPVEFEEIGVNEAYYTDIKCKYILNDKYIPVKQNGLWGLYNIEGKKLIDPKFLDVGCSLAQSGDSVVIVPDVKGSITGIVFLYNKENSLYGVYNAETGEKIALSLTEVFKKVENGIDNYYVNHILDRTISNVHILNLRTDL